MNNNLQKGPRPYSEKVLKKRKMLLVLPLLMIPFLTMAFWALGGGKGSPSGKASAQTGLNLQLPSAHLKEDKSETKLTDYEKADQDSLKREALRNSDPLFSLSPPGDDPLKGSNGNQVQSPFQASGIQDGKDPNEQKVYQKLSELKAQLATPSSHAYSSGFNVERNNDKEGTYKLPNPPKTEEESDPELDKLNGMMDKIIQIQHPERVSQAKPLQSSGGQSSIAVREKQQTPSIGLLSTDTVKKTTIGFFSLEDMEVSVKEDNALPAIIYGTQTLVSGGAVKLCTEQDLELKGSLVPKGSFIYGLAELRGERLEIQVSSIRVGGSLYLVKLSVYDLDGMRGISIPGSISREAARGASDQAIQQIGLATLDPSLAAQATAIGVQAAKTLLTKKVKLVKVTLKAGYQVLLKNEE